MFYTETPRKDRMFSTSFELKQLNWWQMPGLFGVLQHKKLLREYHEFQSSTNFLLNRPTKTSTKHQKSRLLNKR